MPPVKKWKELTEKEVQEIKRNQCCKCFYYSRNQGDRQEFGHVNGNCDYLTIEGHSRGCSPLECTEKGIYRPRNGKGRRKAMRLYA